MNKVPLFVELCAGLASVSGVLEHGSTWKPPVSRMGRKTGYAGAILRVMGLRPRQKAERYLWAEADGDVAALLAAYTQPEVMREIAAIIRSWIPCPYGDHATDPSCSRCKGTGRWDARDLWEVLRREKRVGLWDGFEPPSVAAFTLSSSWSYEQGNTSTGFVGPGDRRQDTSALALDRAAMPWPPVLIAQDAVVDVGSVAGWAVAGQWSYRAGEVESGYGPGKGYERTDSRDGRVYCVEAPDLLAADLERRGLVWPPTALTPSASIPPPPLPAGTVCYIDWPYKGTTGYKHDLPWEQGIEIAQNWKAQGARVYISEAVPVPIPGWHHVEITSERKGQARTFGNTPEWLTCSHPPAWTPPIQRSLF